MTTPDISWLTLELLLRLSWTYPLILVAAVGPALLRRTERNQ